jgi:hypothetical protein
MSITSFSQAPFYQDIFNGGVTAAGFSTGLGSGNGSFVNHASDKERELYEKIIHRQQEEINYLKGLVDVLK